MVKGAAAREAEYDEELGDALDRLVHIHPKFQALKQEIADLTKVIKADADGESYDYEAPHGGVVHVKYGAPGMTLCKDTLVKKVGSEVLQDCYKPTAPRCSVTVDPPLDDAG